MKKQMLMMASKMIKTIVKKDGTTASIGIYYQPKRNK
ncbi:MAG: AgrD family cyclic lactone autoinducer peptide [Eubacteriales bacterium]